MANLGATWKSAGCLQGRHAECGNHTPFHPGRSLKGIVCSCECHTFSEQEIAVQGPLGSGQPAWESVACFMCLHEECRGTALDEKPCACHCHVDPDKLLPITEATEEGIERIEEEEEEEGEEEEDIVPFHVVADVSRGMGVLAGSALIDVHLESYPPIDHTEVIKRSCGHLESVPIVDILGPSAMDAQRVRIAACPCSMCLYPSIFVGDMLEDSLEEFPLYEGETREDRLADLQTVSSVLEWLQKRKGATARHMRDSSR